MLLQREPKEVMFSRTRMLGKNFTEVECVVEEGGYGGLNEKGHNRLIDVNAYHQVMLGTV